MNLEKHSVRKPLLNLRISVLAVFLPTAIVFCLSCLCRSSSQVKRPYSKRVPRKMGVETEETKLTESCFFSPSRCCLTTFFFISPTARLARLAFETVTTTLPPTAKKSCTICITSEGAGVNSQEQGFKSTAMF